MARTNIVAQAPPGGYPSLPITPGSLDLSMTSTSDPTDRSTVLVNTKTMILAHNSDSAAHTITITSVADSLGRKGDITTYSIGAGVISAFGPFPIIGWQQSDTTLWIDVSDPHIQLAVIQLP